METIQRSFEENLLFGKTFEDAFSRFLISQNCFVTPKYLFCEEGAPLLIGKNSKYAIPDIDCAKNGKRIWVECKRKCRMIKHPATGYPYFNHICYKKVEEITGSPVFVVFCDETCIKMPLYYGNWLSELDKNIYSLKIPAGTQKLILFKIPEAFQLIEIEDKNYIFKF